MHRSAAICVALLFAALGAAAAPLRIVCAPRAYATALRAAALCTAAAGKEVSIVTASGAEALKQLRGGSADLILIDADDLPKNHPCTVRRYYSEPLILYVNAENPLRRISSRDAAKLLADERPSWISFNGSGSEIHRLAVRHDGRLPAQKKLPGNPEISADIRIVPSAETGVTTLKFDPGALLFASWLDSVPIEVTALAVDGVMPLRKKVSGGEYPLAVRFCFVSALPEPEAVGAFLRLVDESENRAELIASGRFPLDMQPLTNKENTK